MSTANLERRLVAMAGKPVRLLRKRRRGERRDDDDDKDKDKKPEEEKDGDDQPPPKKDDDEPEDKDGDEAIDDGGKEQSDADPDSPGTIEGYAAVFYSEADPGSEYELWADPGFRAVERVAPGAFSRALNEQDDTRAMFNHDPNMLLGRTASGTLRMAEDGRGLSYSVDLPDTTLGRDVAQLVDRGDVNGSSFGFVVEQESWRETEEPDGKRTAVRTIESVRLLDVGPVTYPAYASTTSGRKLREDDDADQSLPPDKKDDDDGKGDDEEGKSVSRALGSVDEARSSYKRWKMRRTNDGGVPLGAKLAAVRARAVEVSGR